MLKVGNELEISERSFIGYNGKIPVDYNSCKSAFDDSNLSKEENNSVVKEIYGSIFSEL